MGCRCNWFSMIYRRLSIMWLWSMWIVCNWCGYNFSNWCYCFIDWCCCNILLNWRLNILWLWVVSNWGCGNFSNWCNNFVTTWLTTNNSIKAIMFIGCVFNSSIITIGIKKTVRSMYIVTITNFMLIFNVTGMFIMNFIWKIIFGWCIFVFNMFIYWSDSFYNWCSMINCWCGYSFNNSWSRMMINWCCNRFYYGCIWILYWTGLVLLVLWFMIMMIIMLIILLVFTMLLIFNTTSNRYKSKYSNKLRNKIE